MTEADMKRIEQVDRPIVISGRIAGFVSVAMLVLAIGGGWTAAQVKTAVTESRLDGVKERQNEIATKVGQNRDAIMRMEPVLDRINKWLDRQGVE